MKLPVFFRRLARNEFEDSLEWYEKQKPGLGAAFRAGKPAGRRFHQTLPLLFDRIINVCFKSI